MNADEFERVRRDPDPISRGQRATALMTIYQQRATELARLRKEAIEESYRKGLSYKDIAEKLGLTKGRITQIRNTAPRPERAFFGVGPVAVGIPRRYGFEEGRERSFFDASDTAAQTAISDILARLALTYAPVAIAPDQEEVPAGDTVVICGPKSAPVAQRLLDNDPHVSFHREDDGWHIRAAGEDFTSPYRSTPSRNSDIGYFARHLDNDRVTVHIAGITSTGSLGVAHFLDANLAQIFAADPSGSLSGIVSCDFSESFQIATSELIAGPFTF